MKRKSEAGVRALRAIRGISKYHTEPGGPGLHPAYNRWKGNGDGWLCQRLVSRWLLPVPFLIPSRLTGGDGDSWSEEALAALGFGPDPGEQIPLERYQSRDLPERGRFG